MVNLFIHSIFLTLTHIACCTNTHTKQYLSGKIRYPIAFHNHHHHLSGMNRVVWVMQREKNFVLSEPKPLLRFWESQKLCGIPCYITLTEESSWNSNPNDRIKINFFRQIKDTHLYRRLCIGLYIKGSLFWGFI